MWNEFSKIKDLDSIDSFMINDHNNKPVVNFKVNLDLHLLTEYTMRGINSDIYVIYMYSVFTAAYIKMCWDTDVQFYRNKIWLIRYIIRDKSNQSFQ